MEEVTIILLVVFIPNTRRTNECKTKKPRSVIQSFSTAVWTDLVTVTAEFRFALPMSRSSSWAWGWAGLWGARDSCW
jgi:hypothetical protein